MHKIISNIFFTLSNFATWIKTNGETAGIHPGISQRLQYTLKITAKIVTNEKDSNKRARKFNKRVSENLFSHATSAAELRVSKVQ
jgi:hypothetical protein